MKINIIENEPNETQFRDIESFHVYLAIHKRNKRKSIVVKGKDEYIFFEENNMVTFLNNSEDDIAFMTKEYEFFDISDKVEMTFTCQR